MVPWDEQEVYSSASANRYSKRRPAALARRGRVHRRHGHGTWPLAMSSARRTRMRRTAPMDTRAGGGGPQHLGSSPPRILAVRRHRHAPRHACRGNARRRSIEARTPASHTVLRIPSATQSPMSSPIRSPEAKDAAKYVAVDYEPLPAVRAGRTRVEPGAAGRVRSIAPTISRTCSRLGDRRRRCRLRQGGACHAPAFRHLAHHARCDRAAPARWAGASLDRGNRTRFMAASATIHGVRHAFAEDIFKVPENRFRVVAGDIGGTFGSKDDAAGEHARALSPRGSSAPRQIDHPSAANASCSDDHSHDNVTGSPLALDQDPNFLALRVQTLRQPRGLSQRRHRSPPDLRRSSAPWPASIARRRSTSPCSAFSPTRPRPRLSRAAAPRRAMSSKA